MLETFSIGVLGRLTESIGIAYCRSDGRAQLAQLAGMDWRVMPDGDFRERIGEVLSQLAAALGIPRRQLIDRTERIALAIAGIDDRFSIGSLEESLGVLGFASGSLVLASIGEAAHIGAFLGRPGVVISCGGGTSVYAKREDGQTRLFGGWGSVAGDRGSGPWIGRKALTAVTEFLDGTPGEERAEFVRELASASQAEGPVSLLEQVERSRYWDKDLGVKQQLNAFGSLTVRLAEQGDEYAKLIVVRSWTQLLSPIRLAAEFSQSANLLVAFRGDVLESLPYYCNGLGGEIEERFPNFRVTDCGCLGSFSAAFGIALIAQGLRNEAHLEQPSTDLAAALRHDARILPKKHRRCLLGSSILASSTVVKGDRS